MGVVTIQAAHLALANRMVVRKIGFGILLLVAPQTVLAHLPPRLDHSRNASALAPELAPCLAVAFAMNGVALNALEVLGLVWAGKPVPHMIRFRVAAQANAVRFFRRTIPEANDLVFRFGGFPARRNMQAARPVTLFARNFLHRVRAPPVGLRQVSVTSNALLLTRHLRAGDFHELAEVLCELVRRGRLGFVLGGKRCREQQGSGEEKSEEQSASLHSDLRATIEGSRLALRVM